ncbi:GDSL-type esterase/lipase family protein [Kitasatospora sp. NBC_00240]|uniref:golvesin C-terminal-like domain-containing protein n=1 Tax=Kitasatospora sp. NBC_00240 TaxID=2903567 RepID=UPI00225250FB|nr:GDSL-type esterase/lipase family protein [Kitasatospora sp. NBC_00240]MCX5210062.1 GDSL-type esterase/lipase family protein [Kitasatospora sp. NBC_00240]
MVAGLLPAGFSPANAVPAAPAPAAPVAPAPSEVPPAERGATLGPDWASSADRAWTTSSDAEGFHLLVADERDGYAWRTAATLSEPAFEADQWIGNACVTASGERAVVVYAPRTFTNKSDLMARGAFAAVVDLATGKVDKLPVTTTLAYFNPGCGADETAVLTQSQGDDRNATRLIRLDTVTKALSPALEVAGQITSAVPLKNGGIAAADSNRVVRYATDGSRSTLAVTDSVPYYLTPGGDGGLSFLDPAGAEGARAKVLTGAAVSRQGDGPPAKALEVAEGKRTELGLSRGGGKVFVVGRAKELVRTLPQGIAVVQDVPNNAEVSTAGRSVVERTVWADGNDSRPVNDEAVASTRPAAVDLKVLGTGRDVRFTVDPAARVSELAAGGATLSPALTAPPTGTVGGTGAKASGAASRSETLVAAAAGDPNAPVEQERTCSVPRNDPRNQALQPKPRQVEWAVDQAIMGTLNQNVQRPANWKNLGMPAYSPQSLVSAQPLMGGGRVPAQILLGVTAQESNMWQASRVVTPGETGNPLIGNFYGVQLYDADPSNDWAINWADADCGYGVTQVTDHMRMAGRENGQGGTAYDYNIQRAIALDYTANIAVGLTILQGKWNETRAAGLIVNNGDASKIENWFTALWAYNSGLHADTHDGEPWGLGWNNNPANPLWDAGRGSFLDGSPSDAAHPQDWPYPEKVLGFAAHGFSALESPGTMVGSFRTAWWNGTTDASHPYATGTALANRRAVKPPEDLFCAVLENVCNPVRIADSSSNDTASTGPCGRVDFHCWWHQPVTWKADCSYTCGNELVRFNSTYVEEPDGTAYPPNCSLTASANGNALPANALVIDDVPDSTPSIRPGCGHPWTNSGTFTMDFEADTSGLYPSKMDLHQLGAGFGGHFYFSHSRTLGARNGIHEISGTWTLNQPQNNWSRVLVHLPDNGAESQQAHYEIDTGNGSFSHARYINQKRLANRWVSLGVFQLEGVPRVRLSSVTEDGTGDEDIAWDAVAFSPLPGKPKDFVVQMGDSYSSGEGAKPYEGGTDVGPYASISTQGSTGRSWNACRRSQNSLVRKTVLPGRSTSIGAMSDGYDAGLDFQNTSCSGAYTYSMNSTPAVWGALGQHHEMSQLRAGFLDENTTLVTLSIGGNDAKFGPTVGACGDPTVGCPTDAKVRGDITAMVPKMTEVLDEIAARAPNAKIVVLGYPQFFNTTQANVACTVMGNSAQANINSWAVFMKDEQTRAVSESYASPRITFRWGNDEFAGHRICDSDPGLNDLVSAPTGPGDFSCPGAVICPSMESYHPNNPGTGRYALALQNALQAAQY